MNLVVEYLGRVPYLEARARQERAVDQRIAGERGDTLFLLEHPPTMSFGRRSTDIDRAVRSDTRLSEVEFVDVKRGGKTTYHGPGQVVVYPVVHLRERKLGVRAFVELGLALLAETAAEFGVEPRVDLESAGLWLGESHGPEHPGRKLASVGLEIIRGVTNHGFSFNVRGDLSIYRHFDPCGFTGIEVTSLQQELGEKGSKLELEKVFTSIAHRFQQALS